MLSTLITKEDDLRLGKFKLRSYQIKISNLHYTSGITPKHAILTSDEAHLHGLAPGRHGLAVPSAGDRSYMMGSIRDWSRLHSTYITSGC